MREHCPNPLDKWYPRRAEWLKEITKLQVCVRIHEARQNGDVTQISGWATGRVAAYRGNS
jgi:hypothetical protein